MADSQSGGLAEELQVELRDTLCILIRPTYLERLLRLRTPFHVEGQIIKQSYCSMCVTILRIAESFHRGLVCNFVKQDMPAS